MGLLDYSGEGKVKEVQAKENKKGESVRGKGVRACSREKGREERRGEVKWVYHCYNGPLWEP